MLVLVVDTESVSNNDVVPESPFNKQVTGNLVQSLSGMKKMCFCQTSKTKKWNECGGVAAQSKES